jgi:hypothetical protein
VDNPSHARARGCQGKLGIRLIRLNGFEDPSALYLDDPAHFAERWKAALDAAPTWLRRQRAPQRLRASLLRLRVTDC